MFAPVEVWFLSTLSQLCFHIRRLEWPFLVVHGGKKVSMAVGNIRRNLPWAYPAAASWLLLDSEQSLRLTTGHAPFAYCEAESDPTPR